MNYLLIGIIVDPNMIPFRSKTIPLFLSVIYAVRSTSSYCDCNYCLDLDLEYQKMQRLYDRQEWDQIQLLSFIVFMSNKRHIHFHPLYEKKFKLKKLN